MPMVERHNRYVVGILLALLGSGSLQPDPQVSLASGFVFEDRNRNGARDPQEPGIPGVRVSNGEQIVSTDRDGRWQLPCDDDTIFFVIKPAGWMTPTDENNLPRFFYIHKPSGSP
ncbi:MAG: metallophosphoesterase, partial [Armatimonadota bacterium]